MPSISVLTLAKSLYSRTRFVGSRATTGVVVCDPMLFCAVPCPLSAFESRRFKLFVDKYNGTLHAFRIFIPVPQDVWTLPRTMRQ